MADPQNTSTLIRAPYPLAQFDLMAPLIDCLTIDGLCFLDPEMASDPQALALLTERQFAVRSAVMETMHGQVFQKALLRLADYLRQQHFSGATYFQKTPSLRLYLPQALGTSWHCDRWYGHHGDTRTFWIPLTPVPAGSGVKFITSTSFTSALEAQLQARAVELQDINSLCSEAGEEWLCEPGEYLSFCGRTLHGSIKNTSDSLRCSLDFRACASPQKLGNKPQNNYRIVDNGQARDAVPSYTGAQAVKYVCGAGGVSTKYQHVLTEAYAHDNGMSIVRNEAEIEALPSLPVLSAYLQRKVPTASGYSAILMASMSGLPADRPACLQMLKHCADQQISLHFVLEDKVFPGTASVAECLAANKVSIDVESTAECETITPSDATPEKDWSPAAY